MTPSEESDRDIDSLALETSSGTIIQDVPASLAPDTLINHTYRVTKLLGRGGMGEIYLATHVALGTEHAIKVILPHLLSNPQVLQLFYREAKALRKLRNDGVVGVAGYDVVLRDESGRHYLVMEYVEGEPLSAVLQRGPLTSDEVRRLGERLLNALNAAHQSGVVHRDISPDNILLPEGNVGQAKLVDFGIAKMTDGGTVLGDQFAGKYLFASPEQLGLVSEPIGNLTDIYSLGLVLAAALRGVPLDSDKPQAELFSVRRQDPDLGFVEELGLRQWLATMLAVRPSDRSDAAALLSGVPGQAAPAGPPGYAASPVRNRRKARLSSKRVVISATAVVVFLTGGVIWALSMRQPEQAEVALRQIPSLVRPPNVEALKPEPPASERPIPQLVRPPNVETSTPAPPADTERPIPSLVRPQDGETATLRPPLPTPAGREAEVAAALAAIPCAHLRRSNDGARIEGVVFSDESLSIVRAKLAPLGVSTTNIHLQTASFCKLISALSEVGASSLTSAGLSLSLNQWEYRVGDPVTLTVRASARGGYLHVIYVGRDGTVGHMFSKLGKGLPYVLPARETLELGKDQSITAQPPFGVDLLALIETDEPLFSTPRPAREELDAFLSSLQTALSKARESQSVVRASFAYFSTIPQGEKVR